MNLEELYKKSLVELALASENSAWRKLAASFGKLGNRRFSRSQLSGWRLLFSTKQNLENIKNEILSIKKKHGFDLEVQYQGTQLFWTRVLDLFVMPEATTLGAHASAWKVDEVAFTFEIAEGSSAWKQVRTDEAFAIEALVTFLGLLEAEARS